MQTADQMADSIARWIVQGFAPNAVPSTPSIVNGRRYVGIKKDGKEFFVEINVEELLPS